MLPSLIIFSFAIARNSHGLLRLDPGCQRVVHERNPDLAGWPDCGQWFIEHTCVTHYICAYHISSFNLEYDVTVIPRQVNLQEGGVVSMRLSCSCPASIKLVCAVCVSSGPPPKTSTLIEKRVERASAPLSMLPSQCVLGFNAICRRRTSTLADPTRLMWSWKHMKLTVCEPGWII